MTYLPFAFNLPKFCLRFLPSSPFLLLLTERKWFLCRGMLDLLHIKWENCKQYTHHTDNLSGGNTQGWIHYFAIFMTSKNYISLCKQLISWPKNYCLSFKIGQSINNIHSIWVTWEISFWLSLLWTNFTEYFVAEQTKN